MLRIYTSISYIAYIQFLKFTENLAQIFYQLSKTTTKINIYIVIVILEIFLSSAYVTFNQCVFK